MRNLNKKKTIIDFEKLNKEVVNQATFAKKTELFFNEQLDFVVSEIIGDIQSHKIVLVSGPSASGKTTTSDRLMKKLEAKDVASVVVSMDDFFKDRINTPELPDGSKDYENITAVNVDLFKECMDNLLEQGKSFMPLYDFITGERNDSAYLMELKRDTVVIVEGLHAFNPKIVSKSMRGKSYKLYVCVNTDFCGDGTILTADNLRFIRRMVRDYFTRGASVKDSRKVWIKVRDGEERFIKPYRKYADVVIDTTHYYEPYIYKTQLEKISKTDACVAPYLNKFDTNIEFDLRNIADDSLVWEFLA